MKKLPVVATFLLPRLRDLVFIGILYSMILGGPKLFTNDGDLGRHIIVGNYILDHKTIPTRDVFSNTMYGARLVPHEWLAEVAFALAHRVMGLSGDVFLAALLAACTLWLVYEELVRRGNFRLVALFVTLWVAFTASVHWLARPHMFTFFFVAIWTYWLERFYKEELKSIWFFPVLMLIWANTHGAFIAGFVVWGAYFVNWIWEFRQGHNTKEKGRQLILIGGLSFTVTFINPSGWRLWGISVGYINNEFITSHIIDHFSPNFHNKEVWPFLFMIAFALFALAQARKIYIREALLLAGWTAMGLHTIRNIPLFAVITAPIYGSLIQAWAEKIPGLSKQDLILQETEKILRGYVWIVTGVLFFGFVLWRGIAVDEKGTGNIFLPDKMPVQAVDWLEQNPQDGNMFNDFAWGGYILYRMWPHQTVFIDGQADFYGEVLFREYLEVVSLSDNWESILDKHDVSWIIVQKTGLLARHLLSDENDPWNLIYEDSTTVIFSRIQVDR